MYLARSLSTCARTIMLTALPRPAALLPHRAFSSSPIARASEPEFDPTLLMDKVKTSPIVKKMAESPQIMEALKGLHDILQSKGIALSGKPSSLQMMKLAASSDFRTAASRLMEEMQKAGIDVQSKEVMDEIMSISRLAGGTGKPDESK